MEFDDIHKNLVEILGDDNVYLNEDMSKHSSFKTGGMADVFITPSSKEKIVESIKAINKYDVPFTIIGNGTNLLVRDKGIRGVVMSLYDNFNIVRVEDDKIIAQSGALFSAISNYACRASLAGLEFASGIPGTIGGAAKINAGAYGGEFKDVFHSATLLKRDGTLIEADLEYMNYDYRGSSITDEIIVEVIVKLTPGEVSTIRNAMVLLAKKRKEKQPLNIPSAGSTFKRPKGEYAGKLIESAGLKGYEIGGARVSIKHAGFIVNTGEATSTDIETLIKKVQEIVEKNSGIKLEPEVQIIGEE
ncbi:MAG: UDP-N-acetylmuramate dehydrogenase [Clostridiales bacterium]|nr:UDP-N-acetylmuramate dehydrogenase [Clostridiales bacterium]